MRNNNIVILHVFLDGLIFKGMANNYDAMSGVENLYYFYSPEKNFHFQHLADERIKLINDFKEYVSYFSNPEVDVIVFYSLPYSNYYLFDYIDDQKFVIWWAWGYDMYYGQGNNPPLVPMKEMYKPLTKEYMERHALSLRDSFPKKICEILGKGKIFLKRTILAICWRDNLQPSPQKSQDEILMRIDSFYAPLDIEYDFMKDFHPRFTAKQNPRPTRKIEIPFIYKEKQGNVLVNHSLTYTDNHLDVFNYLYHVQLDQGRKYIIPISYGIDGFEGDPENLINVSNLDESQTMWLTQTLPFEEYKSIVDSTSHAIFGMMRQQALGNVYMCLKTGVKIFLFKDSIIYKELKNLGYICFTIEEDLTTESLSQCLSRDDAKRNYDIYMEQRGKNDSMIFRDYLEKSIKEKQGI